MANNKIKPGRLPVPAPQTAEERAAQIFRAFSQQFRTIAEGALYNILRSGLVEDKADEIVSFALDIAEEYMMQSGPALERAFQLKVDTDAARAEIAAKKED